MKKKLLMLLLAGVLVFSNSMLVLAEESTVSPTEEGTDADTTNNTDINTDINTDTNTPGQDSINDVIPNDIQTYGNTNDTVTGKEAVDAINNETVLIIDVRTSGSYVTGHLKGSLSLPVFAEGNVIEGAEAEALWASFTAYVKSNPSTFGNKTIYVLCNSGSRGAVKATELLHNEGYTNVFTIEGGAKNESIQAKFITTEQEQQANQNTGTTTDKKSSVTVATKNSVPETGDTSQTFMYLLLLAASSVILVFRKRVAR